MDDATVVRLAMCQIAPRVPLQQSLQFYAVCSTELACTCEFVPTRLAMCRRAEPREQCLIRCEHAHGFSRAFAPSLSKKSMRGPY
ncbi:hypothetical protein TIFTF001_028327 [Ficus carica]|uniref:Uncharacterized protein n=1 Tax=Ficus carica TaxID=3494 RepID=A0AA88J008_FICCA|nr:hypothetical protein TIFTF001_028327 [Ficus carica]